MSEITAYRIVAPRYASSAFSGIGSERLGGRFSSPGRRLVYTAESISLAVLELLVQAGDRRRLAGYVCIPVTLQEADVTTLRSSDLPVGWDARPYTSVSQAIGDAWLESGDSPVLRVPSVVVPSESNYLLAPLHPRFGELTQGEPFQAPFDARLLDG